MSPRRALTPVRLLSSLVCSGMSAALYAQSGPAPTADDWGGIGMLQTPSARMRQEGELAFTASHVSPYSRYNFRLQPWPWLEAAFRYSNINDLDYGHAALSGQQHYKDKSIDAKVRLLTESRWRPEVAIGVRDLGGTGLFSSEYLVLGKRMGSVDASLGLATGYLGSRGEIANPLRLVDDRFGSRPRGDRAAGELDARMMFRGPIGVFGGIAYQTRWRALQLKLEYDGNDYRNEPSGTAQRQRMPMNVGVNYALGSNAQLQLGWERGTTAMFGLTLHSNLARTPAADKPLDPAPVPRDTAQVPATAPSPSPAPDWPGTAALLQSSAGLRVERIARRGSELVVSAEQQRYRDPAQALGRTAAVLDRAAGPDIHWFTLRGTRQGLALSEASIERSAFNRYRDHRIGLPALERGLIVTSAQDRAWQTLYQAPSVRFDGNFDIDYQQSMGGPDRFLLYQVAGSYTGNLQLGPATRLSGTVRYNAYNNYQHFRYDAPSQLPRVRTDMRQYLTASDLTLPQLQLTHARQLHRDTHVMAYVGLLEYMYAGVGAEILHRPHGQRWAWGVDLNAVRQRGFEQRLALRDYQVVTGHLNVHYAWGNDRDVQASVHAGRYLARDWGATLSLQRNFRNGVKMGAYATRTDVSSEAFGEGSFDKGIFVALPFDLLLPRSTRAEARFHWNPLYRDGGARLARSTDLYRITADADAWSAGSDLSGVTR
ncbi:MAG: YjbH domain-containing protein [Stenotrophomonas sp.]